MMASKKKQIKTLLLALSAWTFVADGLDASSDPLCIVENEKRHVEAITWTEERGGGGGKNPVGCVSQSLVNHDLTFEVKFEEKKSPDNPFLCLKRCREEATFQNSTAALLAMSSDNRLECRCSFPNAVESRHLGPDMFCRRSCATSSKKSFPCGGAHRFRSMAATDVEEIYFSVYCLAFSPPLPPSAKPSSTAKTSTTTTTTTTLPAITTTTEAKPGGQIRKKMLLLLESVLAEMANTDVLFVATIVLVAVITIMVVVIGCLIVRNFRFLAAGVADLKSPILDGQHNDVVNSMDLGYGTRNEAFDPDAEPTRDVYYKTKGAEAADSGSAGVATYQLGQSKFYHCKENSKEADDAAAAGDGVSCTSTVPAAELRSD